MNTDLIRLIERLTGLIRQEAREAGIKAGLQPVQFDALVYLAQCNRYSDTPIAVSEYLGLTKGTVSQTLKLLENKGFIAKQKDEQDKRLTHLKLTETGMTLVSGTYPPPRLKAVIEGQAQSVQGLLGSIFKQLLSEYQNATDNKGFGQCKSCRYNQSDNQGFRCGLTSEPLSAEETLMICREYLESDDIK